jgi:hypothetical protein
VTLHGAGIADKIYAASSVPAALRLTDLLRETAAKRERGELSCSPVVCDKGPLLAKRPQCGKHYGAAGVPDSRGARIRPPCQALKQFRAGDLAFFLRPKTA